MLREARHANVGLESHTASIP